MANFIAPASAATIPASPDWPAPLAATLAKVESELHAGRPQQAIEHLRRADMGSPWAANALGVCQLRLGQFQAAIETFRRLAVADHLTLRDGAPTAFKVNFAAALFLSGNAGGGTGVLKEITEKQHPGVVRLQQAFDRWKACMSLMQRVNWFFGGEPSQPLVLDSPGELR